MEKPSRAKTIVSWIVQVLLGLLFIVASSGKVLAVPEVVEMFRDWGFPDGFYRVIGVLELLGGIGLLVPRVAGYAALGLVGVMIGAAATHLTSGEGPEALRPAIFIVMLAVVVWLRRPWPLGK